MPCTVKKTFEIAKATGNDLIVQVKDNQPNLQHHLESLAATAKPLASDHRRNRARNPAPERQSPSRPPTAVTAPATGRKPVLSRSSTQPARCAAPNGPPSSR